MGYFSIREHNTRTDEERTTQGQTKKGQHKDRRRKDNTRTDEERTTRDPGGSLLAAVLRAACHFKQYKSSQCSPISINTLVNIR